MKAAVRQYFQSALIWLRIPQLYQRVTVWWEFHASWRDYLKAFRVFVQQRGIACRNATFGAAMIVASKQIQTRAELRDMSYKQIMNAYRAGRLDYMMQAEPTPYSHISTYGDQRFHEWVKNGGQIKP